MSNKNISIQPKKPTALLHTNSYRGSRGIDVVKNKNNNSLDHVESSNKSKNSKISFAHESFLNSLDTSSTDEDNYDNNKKKKKVQNDMIFLLDQNEKLKRENNLLEIRNSDLEAQVEELNTKIKEIEAKRQLELDSFKQSLRNSKTSFDKKLVKVTLKAREREELLFDWVTGVVELNLHLEHPHLRQLLNRTAPLMPSIRALVDSLGSRKGKRGKFRSSSAGGRAKGSGRTGNDAMDPEAILSIIHESMSVLDNFKDISDTDCLIKGGYKDFVRALDGVPEDDEASVSEEEHKEEDDSTVNEERLRAIERYESEKQAAGAGLEDMVDRQQIETPVHYSELSDHRKFEYELPPCSTATAALEHIPDLKKGKTSQKKKKSDVHIESKNSIRKRKKKSSKKSSIGSDLDGDSEDQSVTGSIIDYDDTQPIPLASTKDADLVEDTAIVGQSIDSVSALTSSVRSSNMNGIPNNNMVLASNSAKYSAALDSCEPPSYVDLQSLSQLRDATKTVSIDFDDSKFDSRTAADSVDLSATGRFLNSGSGSKQIIQVDKRSSNNGNSNRVDGIDENRVYHYDSNNLDEDAHLPKDSNSAVSSLSGSLVIPEQADSLKPLRIQSTRTKDGAEQNIRDSISMDASLLQNESPSHTQTSDPAILHDLLGFRSRSNTHVLANASSKERAEAAAAVAAVIGKSRYDNKHSGSISSQSSKQIEEAVDESRGVASERNVRASMRRTRPLEGDDAAGMLPGAALIAATYGVNNENDEEADVNDTDRADGGRKQSVGIINFQSAVKNIEELVKNPNNTLTMGEVTKSYTAMVQNLLDSMSEMSNQTFGDEKSSVMETKLHDVSEDIVIAHSQNQFSTDVPSKPSSSSKPSSLRASRSSSRQHSRPASRYQTPPEVLDQENAEMAAVTTAALAMINTAASIDDPAHHDGEDQNELLNNDFKSLSRFTKSPVDDYDQDSFEEASSVHSGASSRRSGKTGSKHSRSSGRRRAQGSPSPSVGSSSRKSLPAIENTEVEISRENPVASGGSNYSFDFSMEEQGSAKTGHRRNRGNGSMTLGGDLDQL